MQNSNSKVEPTTENGNSTKPLVSGSLPTLEQSKKAMLRRKTKFVDNMDKFSSRKNAYKQGWKDCYEWIMSQGNDR
jgi:hypothetical protein